MSELDRIEDELENSTLELPQLESYVDCYKKETQEMLILPTLHNQIQFSRLVADVLMENNIDQVLVELPFQIKDYLLEAIDRLPLVTVIHNGQLKQKGEKTLTPHPRNAYIIHPGESIYWGTYLARRQKIPVQFIDSWHPEAYASWQVPLGYEHLASVGWTTFWEEGAALAERHLTSPIHLSRSRYMMQQVLDSTKVNDTVLVICGAAHWPAIVAGLQEDSWDSTTSMVPQEIVERYKHRLDVAEQPDQPHLPKWYLADIHPHSLHLVTGNFPYYLGRLVEYNQGFDQLESLRQLYFTAERKYENKLDDQVSPSSYRRLFQYLRNLGWTQGKLLPDLYNLIAAAKGMVDDDYAFEVYRTAISYPFLPSDDQKLDQQLKFIPDEEQGEVIRFAFKRRIKRPILKKAEEDEFDDLDPIPDEDYPGQWQEIWDQHSIFGYVSYPPEDEFIEQYMHYLRKRIIEILMEEESSTMEFETSLEDGIDWRETMRHYHEGKIFVKKYPKNKYKVGALVVQFLEEPYDSDEYSHHSTLYAEHDQESHISVITTEPGEVIVGPGISRVKYAAIISQFPPVGMPYLIGKENVELKLRLIWTAMNMSLNKIIGFVAKKPPTAAQRHFAAQQGFRLVYLPMGQLTSQSLRRLRTMHLLAHRDLRDNAREYIGF